MGNLKYANEHKCCFNYNKDRQVIPIDLLHLNNASSFSSQINLNTITNKILYVFHGSCKVVINNKETVIGINKFFLITSGMDVLITALAGGCEFFIFRIKDIDSLCNNYSLDLLMKEKLEKDTRDTNGSEMFTLTPNPVIESFLELLKEVYVDGVKCRFFLENKIKELLFLMRAYFDKKDLYNFFYPVLSSDLSFSQFVLKNHAKLKTVNELAEMANYSLSGFQKRFKKVFGTSAHTWMRNEKMKAIYDDISHTTYSLKELSSKYDFSSPSHFNDYCKANFGYTPGVIRKNKILIHLDSYLDVEN